MNWELAIPLVAAGMSAATLLIVWGIRRGARRDMESYMHHKVQSILHDDVRGSVNRK